MPGRIFTAEQVDAAVAALQDPERFNHAQEVIMHAAPSLRRVLDQALDQGGWFGPAHEQQVKRAANEEDPVERLRAVHTLVDEETRLGMMVGVAVGLELARELERAAGAEEGSSPTEEDPTR
ncbi:MAG TPA: hypothetical protein VHX88_18185 [Solirubrobacteraceae bacterium]|nr:hypothetical protein [Solirubrobacteraceae bacterium]